MALMLKRINEPPIMLARYVDFDNRRKSSIGTAVFNACNTKAVPKIKPTTNRMICPFTESNPVPTVSERGRRVCILHQRRRPGRQGALLNVRPTLLRNRSARDCEQTHATSNNKRDFIAALKPRHAV